MDRAIPVSEILSRKGSDVLTGPEDLTLIQAARRMVEAKVGSLVVMDGGDRVVGILTERDVFRFLARHPDRIALTHVGDIMTRDVIVGLPSDSIDSALSLMTDRHIRHLPILVGGRLSGLVSIGDLVKAAVHEASFEVRMLRDYITGTYPG